MRERDTKQALFSLLFAVEQAANNDALCWEVEEAFLAYEASKAAVEATLRDTPQAEGWVMVPVDVLKAASESLGSFVSDHGWGDADMQAMDNLDAYLTARPSAPTAVEPVQYRFQSVSCSSCGRGFGPGNQGYSHCYQHEENPKDLSEQYFAGEITWNELRARQESAKDEAVEPDERAAFEAAMRQAGYGNAFPRGMHSDSQYLYQRDEDRFVGWKIARASRAEK